VQLPAGVADELVEPHISVALARCCSCAKTSAASDEFLMWAESLYM
jgi:hypothetical protein